MSYVVLPRSDKMIRSIYFAFCSFCCLLSLSVVCESARILTVIPIPSISHQVVFRPLTQALAKRGHQVTVITADPAFPPGQTPDNLTEIDIHDLSYDIWRETVLKSDVTKGDSNDLQNQMETMLGIISEIFVKQILSKQVQDFLKTKPKFDLLIIEACVRQTIIYSHIFKNIPVIQFSSFGGINGNFEVMGAPTNPPLLYPTPLRQRIFNLSIWEKIYEVYTHYSVQSVQDNQVVKDSQILKRLFGENTPSIHELENNIALMMLNLHPLWDQNRPVPPSIVYVGGIHQKPSKQLPKDIQSYLDSSVNGVIYISYGTNVNPSMLPPEKIQMLVKVFSQLSYDVLWKWDKDELPGRSKNIRISKWLPQSDLLKHPKVKLFITQGGLQSTDEAITAGIPLIGMPMLGDQWYNVEQYVHHKIGIRLDMETLTEDKFLKGLNTVLNDDSYRKNMEKLRSLVHDQLQPALDRAVWWTEHVLRHGGGRHLRAPAANMTWAQYLDVELLAVLAAAGLTVLGVLVTVLYLLISFFKNNHSKKLKDN